MSPFFTTYMLSAFDLIHGFVLQCFQCLVIQYGFVIMFIAAFPLDIRFHPQSIRGKSIEWYVEWSLAKLNVSEFFVPEQRHLWCNWMQVNYLSGWHLLKKLPFVFNVIILSDVKLTLYLHLHVITSCLTTGRYSEHDGLL